MASDNVAGLQSHLASLRNGLERYQDCFDPKDLELQATALRILSESVSHLQSLSDKEIEEARFDEVAWIDEPDLISETELKY